MEYCEKSTLRNIIDTGELFTDQKRIWKLFREIVEGLAYIHDTGSFILFVNRYQIWLLIKFKQSLALEHSRKETERTYTHAHARTHTKGSC